jgi:hypothetical protein
VCAINVKPKQTLHFSAPPIPFLDKITNECKNVCHEWQKDSTTKATMNK